MQETKNWQCKIKTNLSEIQAKEWDAISDPDSPFLDHAFLSSLEQSSCVGGHTAWQPHHFLLYEESRLIGALPFYIRYDSYGEYVFDHAWAEAYARAGLAYYPKGLVAIPFSPVNGMRILESTDYDFCAIAEALLDKLFQKARAEGLSSIHFLFLSEREKSFLETKGFLTRITSQFHWENKGYQNFEHYLADLKSERRKQIKKERRKVQEQGLSIRCYSGDDIHLEYMQAMFAFYMDTSQRKWASPYLNWAFFARLYHCFRHRILLILAHKNENGKEIVAGTLNFFKGKKLIGRYWGSKEHFPCLHFELCYYRLIEYAIEKKFDILEAGAQGEHKFLRGFAPQKCYSSHYIFHPLGRQAIQNFLAEEKEYMDHSIEAYNAHSPLKDLRSRNQKGKDSSKVSNESL